MLPFKSHINSNILGYPITISSTSIVSIVKLALVNKFPISLISANGEICGEIPPSLSNSASCKELLKKKISYICIFNIFIY